MAFFSATASLAAGATFNPLEQNNNPWKYSRAPFPALVEILQNATAVGMVSRITTGSDEIMAECPVTSAGVAGVFPARLGVEPITFNVDGGDVIQPVFRNTTAGAITINFTIEMTRK